MIYCSRQSEISFHTEGYCKTVIACTCRAINMSINRAQLCCYIENLAGLFIIQTGRSYAAINNWMVMHCTTNRAQLCCYDEYLQGLSFYKQGAAMPLFIIGWSCIVLQTGRSYAAINNWIVMHCSTNRAQLCCYIENSARLFILQTGRSYAAMMKI